MISNNSHAAMAAYRTVGVESLASTADPPVSYTHLTLPTN